MALTTYGLSTNIANGSTSISLTKPVGLVAGDLIVAAVCPINFSPAIPAGFTAAFTGTLCTVSYRVADGSEGASFAWTSGATQNWTGIICAFHGIDRRLNFQSAAQQTGSGTTVTHSAVTVKTGSLVVAAVGVNSSPAADITYPPAGYSLQYVQNNGGDTAVAFAYKQVTTPGTETPGNAAVDSGVFNWRAVTSTFASSFNRQAGII